MINLESNNQFIIVVLTNAIIILHSIFFNGLVLYDVFLVLKPLPTFLLSVT